MSTPTLATAKRYARAGPVPRPTIHPDWLRVLDGPQALGKGPPVPGCIPIPIPKPPVAIDLGEKANWDIGF